MAAERVAFFGGSFDPPHVGHVLAAVYALATEPIDRVFIAPVFEHPFAKELASFDERLAMTTIAMGWIPNVEVSDVEARLGGASLTLRTLEHLASTRPDWSLRLLVGADVLADLPRWHRFDRIAELAPPIVLGRAGIDAEAAPRAMLPDVSSSQIRDALRRGDRASLRGLVPSAVLDHIVARGLYLR